MVKGVPISRVIRLVKTFLGAYTYCGSYFVLSSLPFDLFYHSGEAEMAPMLPVELLLISSLFLPAVTSNPVPRTIPISRSAGQTIPLYRSAESIRRRSDEQQLRRYAEQEANYLRDRSRRNLEKRDAFGYTIPLENLHRDT